MDTTAVSCLVIGTVILVVMVSVVVVVAVVLRR